MQEIDFKQIKENQTERASEIFRDMVDSYLMIEEPQYLRGHYASIKSLDNLEDISRLEFAKYLKVRLLAEKGKVPGLDQIQEEAKRISLINDRDSQEYEVTSSINKSSTALWYSIEEARLQVSKLRKGL